MEGMNKKLKNTCQVNLTAKLNLGTLENDCATPYKVIEQSSWKIWEIPKKKKKSIWWAS